MVVISGIALVLSAAVILVKNLGIVCAACKDGRIALIKNFKSLVGCRAKVIAVSLIGTAGST